jgi:hypothetical protein
LTALTPSDGEHRSERAFSAAVVSRIGPPDTVLVPATAVPLTWRDVLVHRHIQSKAFWNMRGAQPFDTGAPGEQAAKALQQQTRSWPG